MPCLPSPSLSLSLTGGASRNAGRKITLRPRLLVCSQSTTKSVTGKSGLGLGFCLQTTETSLVEISGLGLDANLPLRLEAWDLGLEGKSLSQSSIDHSLHRLSHICFHPGNNHHHGTGYRYREGHKLETSKMNDTLSSVLSASLKVAPNISKEANTQLLLNKIILLTILQVNQT